MSASNRGWLLTAALLTCGCAGGVNPYAAGTRDDGVQLSPSPLRLILRVGPDQSERVEAAVRVAVDSAGGGTVTAFDGPARSGLLHLARTSPGSDLNADVASYEVTFVARLRDSLAAMTVVWSNGARMKVGGGAVRLLDLGTNKFQLLFQPRPGQLVVSGDQLIREEGGYSFKDPQFKLYLDAKGKRIPLRITNQRAKLRPEPRLLFLQIEGFGGDVNALLDALVGADVEVEGGPVRFSLADTHLWLVTSTETAAAGEAEERGEDERAEDAGDEGDDSDDEGQEEG